MNRSDEWAPEQLRQAVAARSDPPPARPATITVERLDRTGTDGDGVAADVEIRHAGEVERWRLTFDSMWSDVHVFPLEDAALIVRTNIVEWWDTRAAESSPPWLTTERLG